MGHKVHPVGFRLGLVKDWQAKWFAAKPKEFRQLLWEDLRIRQGILSQYGDSGISRVEVERSAHDITVNVHTARPGVIIGRGGQRVEELRQRLEQVTGRRVHLNILEVRQPELDAYLVAKNVAEQLVQRVTYRRVIRQALARTMQASARGAKIIIAGRLAGAPIARREKVMEGRVPLHTLRADIDYGFAEAHTPMGCIGVKVWIYKGDVLPQAREAEMEELAPIEVSVKGTAKELESAPAQESQVP